jgi:hypothetical protein
MQKSHEFSYYCTFSHESLRSPESTKDKVLAEYADKQKAGINPEPFLLRKAGQSFYNTSPLDIKN